MGEYVCTCMGPCVGYVCMHETVWIMYTYLWLYMEYVCGIYVHIWGVCLCGTVWRVCVCMYGSVRGMYVCMHEIVGYICMLGAVGGMYTCMGLCVEYMCLHGSRVLGEGGDWSLGCCQSLDGSFSPGQQREESIIQVISLSGSDHLFLPLWIRVTHTALLM